MVLDGELLLLSSYGSNGGISGAHLKAGSLGGSISRTFLSPTQFYHFISVGCVVLARHVPEVS